MKMNWMYLFMMSLAALDAVPLDPPPESPIPRPSPAHSVRLDSLASNSSVPANPPHDHSIPPLLTDNLIHSIAHDESESTSRVEGGIEHLRVKREEYDEEEEEESNTFWDRAWKFIKSYDPCHTSKIPESKEEKRARRWKADYNLPLSMDSNVVAGPKGVAPFDSALAGLFLFPLAAGSYGNKLDSCASAISGNTSKILANVTVECDVSIDNKTCSGYLVEFPEQKAIALVFRAAKDLDYEFFVNSYDKLSPFSIRSTGKVNRYSLESFGYLWVKGGLEKAVADQLKLHPEYSLWLTGHGVGGSMATIAAAWISRQKLWPTKRMISITFGEPRTGDYEFYRAFRNMKLAAYRVLNQRDFVAKLYHDNPEHWLAFPDLGFHPNVFVPEVYFPDKTSSEINEFIMCNTKKKRVCSDWNAIAYDGKMDDYKTFYNVDVEWYGVAGCPFLDHHRPNVLHD